MFLDQTNFDSTLLDGIHHDSKQWSSIGGWIGVGLFLVFGIIIFILSMRVCIFVTICLKIKTYSFYIASIMPYWAQTFMTKRFLPGNFRN